MDWLTELFPEARFEAIDEKDLAAARARLDSLTKPVGSLGRLEEMAPRLYAINLGETPLSVTPAIFYVAAADHGVAARKVSPFPQAATRQMVENFLAGGAAINCLTDAFDLSLRIIDAGCLGDPFPANPALINMRLGAGTADFSEGPAMSVDVCRRGLRLGFEIGANAASFGYRCVGAGEMGIGNTTTAAALYCAFLDIDPDDAVGAGTGAPPEMIREKARIVRRALEKNADSLGDPLKTLAALGGFEIVELAGIMLACAAFRLPLIVDGFISSAAYVAALKLFPGLAGYAFLAHKSAERGYALVMRKLGAEPYLDLGLRLGEGAGAALLYPMLRGACAVYNDMATMSEAGVSAKDSE